ncbi:MAG TPA: sodium/solute symporter [Clostridiaceae bacterium]|nr:sodium/solute symporter [Clostridiaceae bacterium]
MSVKFLIVSIFVAIMVAIGLYSRKKINNINDFYLGGRNMGPWISAFAYGTTYFSAVIFIGYAGRIGWGFGISATWIGIGNAIIGSLLAWLILAKKTRKMTHELNASTMPEFFEKRYESKAIKIVTALIIFIFLVPYSASVYQGLGYLFESIFGIPFVYCMAAMALITAVYLLLGGYVATALNDFVQGIIMIVGVILMLYYIISHPMVGGLAGGIEKLSSIPGDGPGLVSVFSTQPANLLGLIVLTSLGTWGLPQMVHKFYAIRNEDAIKKATIISTLFAALIGGTAYFTGAFGRLFLNNTLPVGSNGMPNADMVIPQMLGIALPEALMGIIMLLVLSASMSTLSSLVLVSSSAIVLDLIKGSLFKQISNNLVMILMKVCCAVFVLASFLVAVTPNAILTLMSFSWGTVAGSFLAPFIYGLYWKKTTKAGAWSGIITGLVCSLGGAILFGMNASLAPNIGAVSMAASIVVVPIVSLLTARQEEKYEEKAYGDSLSKIGA